MLEPCLHFPEFFCTNALAKALGRHQVELCFSDFFIPQNTGSSSVSAVGIFVGIVLIALALLGAVFGYKRYRDNRYKRKRNSSYNL